MVEVVVSWLVVALDPEVTPPPQKRAHSSSHVWSAKYIDSSSKTSIRALAEWDMQAPFCKNFAEANLKLHR